MREEIKSVILSSSREGNISLLTTEIIARNYKLSVQEVREYATSILKLKLTDQVYVPRSAKPNFQIRNSKGPSIEIKERTPFATQIERLLR